MVQLHDTVSDIIQMINVCCWSSAGAEGCWLVPGHMKLNDVDSAWVVYEISEAS
jgi:hypothetical protein